MRQFIFTLLSIIFSAIGSNAQEGLMKSDTIRARQFIVMEKELSRNGRYDEAIQAVQQAKDIYTKYELWKNVVWCEVQQAIIADNYDSPDLKIQHANKALILADLFLEKDNLNFASAFRQKAESLMWIEDLDSANYFLNKALPIFIKEKEWEQGAWTEVLLAVNYLNSYQLDSCVWHLNEVASILKTYELTKETYHELQTTLFDLRGITYEFQGDFNMAISNLNEALEMYFIKKKLTVSDSGFISNQFNTLGTIYLAKGDHLRAEDNFLQALHFEKKAINDPNLLFNIGHQYLKQKKYLRAIEYFEKIENLFNDQLISLPSGKALRANYYSKSLNGLCSCYLALGRYERAMSYCEKAESQWNENEKYITWAIMGNIYIDKEQPKEAFHYLRKANLMVSNNSVGLRDRVLIQSRILYLLGVAHQKNQNYQQALSFYQKSLASNHNNFIDSLNLQSNPSLTGIYNPIYFLETISAKAKTQMLLSTDDSTLRSALATYQLTIQWIDSLQISYALEATLIDWSSEFKPIYEEAIKICYELYKNTKEAKYIDLAFSFSEKSRSSILLEQLKSKEGKSNAGIPDSLLQLGKDLNLDIVFYENKLEEAIEVKDSAKIKLYQTYLSQSRLNQAALEEKLEKDYPKFYQAKYASEQISISQIQENLLEDKSALLEYFIGDSVSYVFVIVKDMATMIQFSDLENIKSDVEEFLVQLKDLDAFKRNAKAAVTDYNKISSDIYSKLLVKPITYLSKDINNLIIIPDGILNAVPFEALTKEENEVSTMDFSQLPFLIYNYQIQYSYSAQLLFENSERSATIPMNTSCLGFAPTYGLEKSLALEGSFDQLRNSSGNLLGTADEISQISRFVEGKYWVGKEATERRFKSESEEYGMLHLAMHGSVDLANSNYNHLKFSSLDEDDSEDNLLHQYEIANLDLNAQMVVLSACETGIGKYEKGEGVFSMARSFMQAGVPSVVMSLWRVSDASTSQLMPEFYKNLANKQSKVTALHQAKLNYLESSNLEMRHPFYWSAFVLIGDGDALITSSNNYYYWAIALFVILLCLLFLKRLK